MSKNVAIDKKTSKLLKFLEKYHNCRIEHGNKKANIMVLPPKNMSPYLIHVGHKQNGEKVYHPLRRWANNTFNLALQ